LTLLGRSTWWFPNWLERVLPNFAFEDSDAPAPSTETKPSDGDERIEELDPVS
jgi:hypothetical protein